MPWVSFSETKTHRFNYCANIFTLNNTSNSDEQQYKPNQMNQKKIYDNHGRKFCCVFDDSDDKAEMNSMVVKRSTGSMYFNGRGIYSDNTQHLNRVTNVFAFNNKPNLDISKRSMTNRLQVLSFPVAFRDTTDPIARNVDESQDVLAGHKKYKCAPWQFYKEIAIHLFHYLNVSQIEMGPPIARDWVHKSSNMITLPDEYLKKQREIDSNKTDAAKVDESQDVVPSENSP